MHAVRHLPRFSYFLSTLAIAALFGCGDDDSTSSPDASVGCLVPELTWTVAEVGSTPGVKRSARLRLARDFCIPAEIALESLDPSIATVPASVTLDGITRTPVEITAVAIGMTTIRATLEAGGETRTAELDVVVTDTAVPACTGSSAALLSPSGEVRLPDGTGIALPAGASRDDRYSVAPFEASIACAPDQIPAGYRALGPAVSFGPGTARFARELPIRIPIRPSILQEGAHFGHVEISYTGPGVAEPRIVPVASPWVVGSQGGGLLEFQVPRLGTYQAVVRTDVPVRRTRNFTYRGITGFSMGAGGSALIGLHNPETFDFVAPLGGPVDWIYMLDYIRRYHLGGFCTEEQRAADPTGCAAGADQSRIPPRNELYEHHQDFEHWWYDDMYGGQGGTFDRQEYIRMMRDITYMYGNINTDRTTNETEPNITPPGVPDSERMRQDSVRCSNPVRIPACDPVAPSGCAPGTGYFDDEYNPDGQYAAIAFCDGGEIVAGGERDIGIWDPNGANTYPIEVVLAIDVDGDMKRDPGEPVVRAGHEPYDDCGIDRLCNADEPGFDARTNPDPNGDDYDFQYNPNGTEANRLREGDPCDAASGEAFLDSGLDGVLGTAQLDAGGFDRGEGNGCWDVSSGMRRMLERNPRTMVLESDVNVLRDIDVMTDGGIRDLFNFAVAHDHFAGAFVARGLPMRLFNSHAALHQAGVANDDDFVFTRVPWNEIGRNVMIRYGDVDADEGLKTLGDGGHVGTNTQVINRLLSSLAWMSARWPNADRTRVSDRICSDETPACEYFNHFAIEFMSPSSGRTGPAVIVLPPGYFAPENASQTYPVVFFLHGYGMDPQDLIALGLVLWTYMGSATIPEAERLQKMIFVFPDGRCRGEECEKGTFFTDAPPGTPAGAQMETFMLELMEYMDANYRTRPAEDVDVVE